MMRITRDPDSGVIDQCCADLDPKKVTEELALCLKRDQTFLGKPASFWREFITDQAQAMADAADPDEYEIWGIKYLEQA